jgi:hypothetical protein
MQRTKKTRHQIDCASPLKISRQFNKAGPQLILSENAISKSVTGWMVFHNVINNKVAGPIKNSSIIYRNYYTN